MKAQDVCSKCGAEAESSIKDVDEPSTIWCKQCAGELFADGREITVKWYDGCPMYSVNISQFKGIEGSTFVFKSTDGKQIRVRGIRSLARALFKGFLWASEVEM